MTCARVPENSRPVNDRPRLNVRTVVVVMEEKGPGDAINVLGAQPGWRPQR